MEALGKFTLAIIMLVIGVFISLLLAHIVLSIANLYQLKFITQYSFVQIFGAIYIINLLKFKYSKSESDDENVYAAIFKGLLTTVLTYLFSWGLAFLMFHFIK